jgi:hypothetical protein
MFPALRLLTTGEPEELARKIKLRKPLISEGLESCFGIAAEMPDCGSEVGLSE